GAISAFELEFYAAEAQPRRIGLSQRVAALWRAGVGDVALAIEAYRRLTALDSRSESGWQALAVLYDTARRDDDLVIAKEQLLGLAQDAKSRVGILRELADIHDRRRMDPPRALESLRRAC